MNKNKILYRADGGHPVGMGHIMRAVRLFDQFASLSYVQILLVSRKNAAVEKIVKRLKLSFVNIHWMDEHYDTMIPILGVNEFLDVAKDYDSDLIIIDALDTEEEDMRLLASLNAKLVTQDDRGPGRKFADLLSNFLVRDPDPSELKPGAVLIEGPQYAPLGPDYVEAGKKRRPVEPDEAGIVSVSMGGADAVGLAVKVAEGLAMLPNLDEVKFSVGPAFQHFEELEKVTSKAAWKTELLVNVPSLLPVFMDSDIAIVAGGITMHEAACCGVPSIAVCQPIDHQLLVGGWLQDAGAMLNLGYGNDLKPEDIADTVSSLVSDQAKRQHMAEAGPKTVDGLGIKRVAEAIMNLLS